MRRIVFASAVFAVVGCQSTVKPLAQDEPGPSVVAGPPTTTLPVDHPPIVGMGGSGGAGGSGGNNGSAGGSGTDPQPVSYGARRLRLSQVEGTILNIFGNDLAGQPITWRVGTADGFNTRGDTLGVPDYIDQTAESLEPSPLYIKFMSDMARSVCNQAVAADLGGTVNKVLYRTVQPTDTVASARANIDENLRQLKLIFHGIKVDPADDRPIAALRSLFESSMSGTGTPTASQVSEGWRAVCVSLLTAPEFHLY